MTLEVLLLAVCGVLLSCVGFLVVNVLSRLTRAIDDLTITQREHNVEIALLKSRMAAQ